ncbi:MAG: molybdopterin dinucleotide-binding protein [Methanoregula sp.]|nr:MAG: molybdopterin dinucleotide-binding protein [Methanoregula sp.]
MKFLMNTGRTVPQGESVERKDSPEYEKATSVCMIHPVDMMVLGIEDGARVCVKNKSGEVVLVAVSSEAIEQGTIFVPLGPYANHIIDSETHCTGMPDFKSMTVDIEPGDTPVMTVSELIEKLGGVRYAH